MSNEKKKIILLTSFFNPVDIQRKREIEVCMRNNIRNREIDQIINIGTKFEDPKIKNIYKESRPTFKDFLDEMRKNESDYYILANADIFFCKKISKIKEIEMKNRVLCLTRWDITKNGEAVHYNQDCSQDAWIFNGKPPRIENVDFEIGKPACDGRFAFEIKNSGFEPINPSLSIFCYHVHKSKERDYCSVNDRVAGEVLRLKIEDYTRYKKK